ncbi:UDP-N-acetylglucosamine 2-epimerase (non-hydrolyzing) [Candidatus Pacearchaeota archaeon]|nr:UDP-N-acetylglucosamine 2-epimerase (non-hydrolyzing) [Candidatus Pacearchaeota archaeon]
MKNKNIYKIAIILGTRAELIKTFPVMLELDKQKIPYYFIHTGQHNLKDLCETFGVKKPDISLSKEHLGSSKFNSKELRAITWNLGLLFKIKRELSKLPNLKYVIYHGDTMTTFTAALASSKLFNPFKKYKNIHLEAGLRSWNIREPFPEEISRRVAGRFSDILLAPSKVSGDNLKKLNKDVYVVGNTVVDSAVRALKIGKKNKTKILSKDKFALITVHRHENLKSKERLSKIVDILSSLTIPSFFAMHDNTEAKLKEFGLYEKLMKNKNIKIMPSMDYPSFICQMEKCSLIVCDGGSMQEESLIFGTPCVVLRMATERQEGLETNFQFLSKLDVEGTKAKIREYLSKDFKVEKFKNPYGNPGVSKKVVEILR